MLKRGDITTLKENAYDLDEPVSVIDWGTKNVRKVQQDQVNGQVVEILEPAIDSAEMS